MGSFWDDVKVTLLALTRQGAKEMAQILPAFPDSVKPVEQLGMPGNPTQMEVNHEKGKDDAYRQWLGERAHEAAPKGSERPDAALER